MQSVRSAVLQHMRVGVAARGLGLGAQSQSLFGIALHPFSSEAHGTYLDKGIVTDRVLSIVKKMQKVDGAKVSNLQSERKRDCVVTTFEHRGIQEN